MTPEDLKRRRKALRLSQAALGELLGVAGNTIYRWEAGEVWPPANEPMLELALIALENGHGIYPRDFFVHVFGQPGEEVMVQTLTPQDAPLEFVMKVFAPIAPIKSYDCVVTTPDGRIVIERTVTSQEVSERINQRKTQKPGE